MKGNRILEAPPEVVEALWKIRDHLIQDHDFVRQIYGISGAWENPLTIAFDIMDNWLKKHDE